MGVDTVTYRARIGTFKHAFGHDVVTQRVYVCLSLLRRIIITELLCSLMLLFTVLENNIVMKLPQFYMNTIHWPILYNYHVPYAMVQPTVFTTLEVLGSILLFVAVLPDKHSTETGHCDCFDADESLSNVSKRNVLRHTLPAKTIRSLCVIGSLSFIGMLLLMAGVEPNPGPNGGETEGHCLLRRLGLSKYHPGKIELCQVISVNSEQYISLKGRTTKDLPWILLKKIMSLHGSAFCLDEPAEKVLTDAALYDDSSDEEESTDVSEEINYLDVFLLTYQCCSPRVQQLLFQKMFLCRFAVPFLIRQMNNNKSVVSIWPMRFLVCESYVNGYGECEEDVLKLPIKCVAFCRIGRPRFSKSKMLNKLVSDTASKTFFNIDCQSGKFSKTSCSGYIETFWLLRAYASDKNVFDDATMFLNMRGCLKSEFAEHETNFVGKFVDVISVFIDKEEYIDHKSEIKNLTNIFKSVIVVIIEHNRIKTERPTHQEACKMTFLRTFDKKNNQMKRDDEIKSEIIKHIKEHTKDLKPVTFKERFKTSMNQEISTDEQLKECKLGKTRAIQFCNNIHLKGEFLSLKDEITPIQSKVAKQLGQLLKELKREKDIEAQDVIRAKIKTERKKALINVTDSIIQFITVLATDVSLQEKFYFLEWLQFKISRHSRRELFQLKLEHKTAWENFQLQKGKPMEQDDEKDKLLRIESQIDAASFSVGYLFREVGLIYDTICELQVDAQNLPPVERIASIIGDLTVNGHQLEIIDGDSFYLQQKWLSKIVESIDRNIKVITLGVLGVQSSGKSTLLNTMFSLKFPTRVGRCTRGINAQMVPSHGIFDSTSARSEYILILDTEGLRPTEVIHTDHEHDNEVATLITGLGDTTLVTVMGENTQEIRDILQIVTHAFLRLKLANKRLDINKHCEIILQNITSNYAKKYMHAGLIKLITSLDEMTEDSAKCEGIYDISMFNEVIKFDTSDNVWYLNNVWDGNPPFARVNLDYSEKARQIKLDLLQQCTKFRQTMSCKTLQDFILQTGDMWHGVLNENFVFSFKNSFERKAYLHMDEWIQGKLSEIESCFTESIRITAQEHFSGCDTQEVISTRHKEVLSLATELLRCKRKKADDHLKMYFETSEYRLIVIQWKENQLGRIQRCFDRLGDFAEDTVRKERDKHKTKLLLRFSHLDHDLSLEQWLLDYAKNHSVKTNDIEKTNNLFEQCWSDVFGTHKSVKVVDCPELQELFRKNLLELHDKHYTILSSILEQMGLNENTHSQVSLNFEESTIDSADITVRKPFTSASIRVSDEIINHVEMLYKAFRLKIDILCYMNEQISELHIRQLHLYMQDMIKSNKRTVQKSFYMKIYVHVSLFAANIFNKHNETIFKQRSADLETYKRHQKVLFEKCLKLRQAEDAVAEIITDVIFEYLKEESVAQFSSEIQDILHGLLPSTKHLLIEQLYTHYVNERNFSEIYYYIHHPLKAAEKWLNDRANKFVLEGKPNLYSSNIWRIVNTLISKVTKSISSLNPANDVSVTSESLVRSLRSALSANNLFISIADFGSVQSCNQVLEVNLQAVCDAIITKLPTLNTKLTDSFNKDEIWWRKINPIHKMFKTIWGCTKVCPYCREPCENSSTSHSEEHSCAQHRPKCCGGVHSDVGEIASANTCSYAVQSSLRHACKVWNYICNDGKANCWTKWHKYSNYQTYCKDWVIPPSSDMHDSSKFWLWFVGTFRDNLAKAYNYNMDKIPESWSKISDHDAKESLKPYYR